MRSCIPDRKDSLVQSHKAQNPSNPGLSDFEAVALRLGFCESVREEP